MKIGIMQPYFMPYIGYFSLIKNTDKFILLDTVQFIRHGWIERNRVLKQNGGWLYISIPILKQNGRETLIKDITINNNEKWKSRILAQLQHYRRKAPYYNNVISLLDEIFSQEFSDIVTLNKNSLEKICDYLRIESHIEIFSEMNLSIEPVNAPDEWALSICKAIDGVNEYWNPIGGTSFFDRQKYEKQGIKILFQEMNLLEYNQKLPYFEAGLSIIDVLMFNSTEDVVKLMDSYKLVE